MTTSSHHPPGASPLDTESARRIGDRVVEVGAEFQTAVMLAETGHLSAREAYLACVQLCSDLHEIYRWVVPVREMARAAQSEQVAP